MVCLLPVLNESQCIIMGVVLVWGDSMSGSPFSGHLFRKSVCHKYTVQQFSTLRVA